MRNTTSRGIVLLAACMLAGCGYILAAPAVQTKMIQVAQGVKLDVTLDLKRTTLQRRNHPIPSNR